MADKTLTNNHGPADLVPFTFLKNPQDVLRYYQQWLVRNMQAMATERHLRLWQHHTTHTYLKLRAEAAVEGCFDEASHENILNNR
jgi:hypothetical protein